MGDHWFLIVFYGFLAIVAGGHFLLNVLPIHLAALRAVTPEQKRKVVLMRLEQSYMSSGHPDPLGAACDHLNGMEDMERFRRHACSEYVRADRPLDEVREEWISARMRAARANRDALGNSRYDGVRSAEIIADALRKMPADEVYIYEPAASKWKAADAAFWREHEAYMRNLKLDPAAAHVAEAAFAAGNRL